MARTRMEWDWIYDYPVFVYTTFITENEFNVKIVLGTKGDQNAGGTGPKAEAYMEYVRIGLNSKFKVVVDAFKRVERELSK